MSGSGVGSGSSCFSVHALIVFLPTLLSPNPVTVIVTVHDAVAPASIFPSACSIFDSFDFLANFPNVPVPFSYCQSLTSKLSYSNPEIISCTYTFVLTSDEFVILILYVTLSPFSINTGSASTISPFMFSL